MELKTTNLKFQGIGIVQGLDRTDHQYGVNTRQTTSGNEFKTARFDFVYDTKLNLKTQINIRGYVQDKARCWNVKENKLESVPWDDRFDYEDNKDIRVFPQPYDAASNIEFAENGEKYYISGNLSHRFWENKGKQVMYTDYYADEATPTDEGRDCYLKLRGDFVYTGVEGNRVKGVLIDYKKNVFPVAFYWGGDSDVLADIKNQIPYGSTCAVTNGEVTLVPASAATTKKSFGTSGESFSGFGERKVVGYVLYGIDVKNNEPYTKEDLTPKKDDDDEELFEV